MDPHPGAVTRPLRSAMPPESSVLPKDAPRVEVPVKEDLSERELHTMPEIHGGHKRWLTRPRTIVLIACVVLFLLWDVDEEYKGTVLESIGRGVKWLFTIRTVCIGFGVLVGHYCWPRTVAVMEGDKVADFAKGSKRE